MMGEQTASTDSRQIPPLPWAGADTPEYIAYMQNEWGVPVRRDRRLFEMLVLEIFQAGLSWAIILKRRRHFREAFANWDFNQVAAFTARDRKRLLRNPGIIRNQRKIQAAITNAGAIIEIRRDFKTFSRYLWDFIGGEPITPSTPYRSWNELPATSPLALKLSRDMKQRGFTFIGPTSCYAFMQAVGLVDDRVAPC